MSNSENYYRSINDILYRIEYSEDDLKKIKKLKLLKTGSYCLSLVSFLFILKYWNNDSNALADSIVSISSSVIASIEYFYADSKEEEIKIKCRKKIF